MDGNKRYAVLAVLFAAYFTCYMDRMVIATALPFIAKDFGLSSVAMGGVLSAFFFGYALMQIPGGLLADVLGPTRVLTLAIICWSAFTAFTGFAASLTSLLVIRALFGLSEGPFPPAASKAIAMWFSEREVGRANGIQLASINIGAAVAPLIVAPLVIYWGWRVVFYVLFVPGLVLAAVVYIVLGAAGTAPKTAESKNAEVDNAGSENRGPGIIGVLKTPAVLWCALTLFFGNMAGWGLMNWLPTYLLKARGFSVSKMGLFASLPFLAGAVGFYLGGYISDKYFKDKRQVPVVGGLVLGAGMTFLAASAPTGEWAVGFLVLAFLFLFVSSAGTFTLPLVLVPRAAVGAAFGAVNTAGQIAAFLSPLAVGFALKLTHDNFTTILYGIVAIFGAATLAATQIRQPQVDGMTRQPINT